MLDTSISEAVLLQQTSTYWIKTIVKNQYVYGNGIFNSYKNLLNSKEYFRFYSGYIPNMIKVLIGRNSDLLFHKYYSNQNFNKEKTAILSGISSSIFKIITMPFDTVSNLYQIHGNKAKDIIIKQHRNERFFYFRGTIAYMSITSLGSSSWLYTYSKLNDISLPYNNIVNNAIIGCSASLVSDLVVNPIRILKTYKQSNEKYISYKDIFFKVIKNDNNLFKSYFRGFFLRTGLNSVNSGIFVVLWKHIELKKNSNI